MGIIGMDAMDARGIFPHAFPAADKPGSSRRNKPPRHDTGDAKSLSPIPYTQGYTRVWTSVQRLGFMTTIHSYQGIDRLRARIAEVRTKRRLLSAGETLFGGLAVFVGLAGLIPLLGYWPGQPPVLLRYTAGGLLALCGLGIVASLAWVLLRPLSDEELARWIELRTPSLRNELINPLLLARDADPASRPLVQQAIHESLWSIGRLDLSAGMPTRRIKRRAIAVAVLCFMVAVFALLQPGVFHRGLMAGLTLHRFVPRNNTLPLVDLAPGDATVAYADRVPFRISVRDDSNAKYSAELVIAGRPEPILLAGGGATLTGVRTFQTTAAVTEDMEYLFRIHRNQKVFEWPTDQAMFHLRVHRTAFREGVLEITPPAYTGMEAGTWPIGDTGVRRVPLGSWVVLHTELDAPVADVQWVEEDGPALSLAKDEDARHFGRQFTAGDTIAFHLRAVNEAGDLLAVLPGDGAGGRSALARLEVIPDAPPKVAFRSPTGDIERPPGADVLLHVEASDAYGLTKLELWGFRRGEQPQRIADLSEKVIGQSQANVEHAWTLPEGNDGDVLFCYAVAADNRSLPGLGGSQSAITPKRKITLRSAQSIAARQADLLTELHRRLLVLLEAQLAQRVNTSICHRAEDIQAMRNVARDIRAGQKDILAGLKAIPMELPLPEDLAQLDRVISLLSANEATIAIDQADVLAGLDEMSRRDGACWALGSTQDAIIRALQDMLAVAPALAARKAREADVPADDLPASARLARREALRDNMQRFIEEQARAIEAGKDLTKKPLDDFTPAEQQQLEALRALQDRWEQFLNEAIADFSKLHNQDFSNPSLLRELISVKADVTMAKDALAKEAIEIATAAEQNALENAQELTANLEKWLPDEPDRKSWQMEAPEADSNVEQAELPEQLEDLVGDLLEEEEDLFEAMDDLTSEAAGSFDKGAGWDAQDGPISSTNAQGVTGNQLPNTSEVSGRSGEGRTGKSSGEFVADKAEGKGGRRTPTRMGDEPFQAGQVDDTSSDPPGGATGGGKRSGAGQEGLEGSAPGDAGAELPRLAGRQAALINRAERIAAGLQPGDYSTFRIRSAIVLMQRVRDDLARGEYRNALRRREETLSALRQSHRLLAGKVEVTADPAAALPENLRMYLADIDDADLPAEYREMLREYYRRLAEPPGR